MPSKDFLALNPGYNAADMPGANRRRAKRSAPGLDRPASAKPGEGDRVKDLDRLAQAGWTIYHYQAGIHEMRHRDGRTVMAATYRACLDAALDELEKLPDRAWATLPMPPPSACWMCPNKPNEEWRYLRDNYPSEFEQACQLDEEVRAEDQDRGHPGVWLHHSRQPLRTADLEADDRGDESRQCGLGMCFV